MTFSSLRVLWRVIIAIMGGTVLLIGVALLVLPGPGWLTIIFGLAVLGSEFIWARRALRKVKQEARVVERTVRKEVRVVGRSVRSGVKQAGRDVKLAERFVEKEFS